MQSKHLSFIITLNYCIFWPFIKLYIKLIVNQHFNFLLKPVTSHCSAHCYELFQTIWISTIKRCRMNSNSNIMLVHKLVIGDRTFWNYIVANSGNNLQIFIDICSITRYLCSKTSLGILCRSIIVNRFLKMIYHNCLDSSFMVLRLI